MSETTHAVDARYARMDSILRGMPRENAMRWCEAEFCCCLGCANHFGGLQKLGYTKSEWDQWKEKIQK